MQSNPANESKIGLIHMGPTTKVSLPSGREIVIREQNGRDDDILSKVVSGTDGSNILNFISSITEEDKSLKRKPLPEDIKKWHTNDRYVALIASRIHSLGKILSFEHVCSNAECKRNKPGGQGSFKLTEDVGVYIGDFKDPNYKPKYIYSATPYKNGMNLEVELVLTSKKKVKFKIKDFDIEQKELEASDEERTNNLSLTIRELRLFIDNNWEVVHDFQCFSPRDMVELRKGLVDYDPTFTPLTRVQCPTCGNVEWVNILYLPDFFYPLEM